MLGSVIGDIVGSIYEFSNIKTKDFEFFQNRMEFTDDSILTLATADWLLNGGNVAEYYVKYGNKYPHPMGGYGTRFIQWLCNSLDDIEPPYNSCGNGSAMRVGPVGWAFETKEETLAAAKKSAECTHNHPEGIKGAQATALAIFMARKGHSKEEIKNIISTEFNYDLSLTVEELRPIYSWKGMNNNGNAGICQETVPQALICALDAISFEDAVRNAISIGGDSDTLGCITGSIAEAIYGIPEDIYKKGFAYLDKNLQSIVTAFEAKYK